MLAFLTEGYTPYEGSKARVVAALTKEDTIKIFKEQVDSYYEDYWADEIPNITVDSTVVASTILV